jgi:hypothetical protein
MLIKVLVPVLQVQENILLGDKKPENHTIRCDILPFKNINFLNCEKNCNP